jgi:cellulose synthase operon protein C
MAVLTNERGLVEVDREDLDRVRRFYDAGDCLGAYEVARAIGPLECWRGAGARVMAGRLAAHLGALRLAEALHLRAWRDDPADPEA